MATLTSPKPVRVGVFETVAQADRAVHHLLGAGFTREQVSVICSDKHKAALFQHNAQTPAPAGTHTPEAIVVGSVAGAAVGGLAMAASALVTGGASLLIAGGALIGGGALAGSFTGAMMTRGLEPETVNYYDQAVQHGKILVAVEVDGEGNAALLKKAEEVLRRDGTTPVALQEG